MVKSKKKHAALTEDVIENTKIETTVYSSTTTTTIRTKGHLRSFTSLHEEGFAYLADNAYIHTGYRLHYNFEQCFYSLFQLHNETINVWTHMIGALIFITWGFFFLLRLQSEGGGYGLGKVPSSLNPYDYFDPAPCDFVGMKYLSQGHHTRRMFHSIITTNDNILSTCAPVHQTTTDSILTRDKILFDQILTHIPTLEDVQTKLASMPPAIGQHLVSIKSEVEFLRESLQHETEWLTRESWHQLIRMKSQITHRVGHFQEILSQLKKDAEPSIQYALEEYNMVMGMIQTGLHRLEFNDNTHSSSEAEHHVPSWPLVVFICSATFCLASSSIYHLYFVVDSATYYYLSRLDYAGINVMIAGSFYPIIYYAFFCQPKLILFYLASITTMACITFVFSLVPAFGTAKYILLRTGAFVGLGGFAFIPMGHLIWKHGISGSHVVIFRDQLLVMGAFYIFGACIYAFRFPERYFPGKFDVWFSSHQLWHICVVLAAMVHYHNVMQHYEWRWNHAQCPS